MYYTPAEWATLEKALYLTLGSYPFSLPMDTPPHPQEGWKSKRGTRLHEGLDFGAPIGSPVYAAGPGTVSVSRDWGTGTGKWIVIEHSAPLEGFQTRYIHLDKRLVKVGDRVAGGDPIARSGNTGARATIPHLHFDMQVDLKQHPEIKTAFTRKFIGRAFHGKRNIPAEILLPLADADRPGLIEPGLVGSGLVGSGLIRSGLGLVTERPWMPPPGIPIVPRQLWIVSVVLALTAGVFFYTRARSG